MDSRIITAIIVVVVFGLIGLVTYFEMPSECKIETKILKGVNGITDENSGLFSSGDVERTSLLMEDGTIISVSYRIKRLKLGKPIQIKKCSLNGGGTRYSIITQ